MEPLTLETRQLPHTEVVEILDNYRKRTSPAKDAELVESIKKHGVLQPVCVRPREQGGYALIFGRRRFLASQAAGCKTIFAIIRPMSDDEVRFTQLIENGQREDAHPIEDAEAFKQLQLALGYSIDEIAARVGKSTNHVRLRLKLCDLAEPVRAAFFDDNISTQVAYLLARLPNQEEQLAGLDFILDASKRGSLMSANEVHAYLERNFMLQLQNPPFDKRDGTLVPEAGACGSCPKHTGNQRDLFGEFGPTRAMCTDAACFNKKVEATYLRKSEQALTKGHEVLSPEESTSLFPHGTALARNSPYVDLDAIHLDDPTHRTYRQLLRKRGVPLTLAIDGFHRSHDLALKLDVDAALQAAGYDFILNARSNEESARQNKREHRKTMADAHEKQNGRLAAIVAGAEKHEPDAEFWRILVLGLTQGSWHAVIAELVKRRGLHVKGTPPEDALAKSIETASAPELRGIALELVIRRGSNPLSPTDVFQRAAKKLASQP